MKQNSKIHARTWKTVMLVCIMAIIITCSFLFLPVYNASAEYDPTRMVDLKTLTGHSGEVLSVSFSPDNKYLASGSLDNTIKIWDVNNNWNNIQTLHSSAISSVAFSSDGKYLASGSWDDSIKIWDTSDWTNIKTLTGHSNNVYSVSFSPDNKYLASGSRDNTIKIWDVNNNWTNIKTLTGHSYYVRSVSFSPDNKYLASGSEDNTIKIWDVNNNWNNIQTLTGHSGDVYSVSFSPDNKYLASGSTDKTIKIWDTSDWTNIKTLTGHSGEVLSVSFSPDNKYLASGSVDYSIKIWDTSDWTNIKTLTGHSNFVYSVSFSPDNKYLASGSRDHKIKIWGYLPDLTISPSDISFSKQEIISGDTIGINATIRNIGLANATNFNVRFYFDSSLITQTNINVLEESTQTISIQWNVPLIYGTHTIGVRIDEVGLKREENENNNQANVVVIIKGTDLTIQDIQFSKTKPTQGDNFIITTTIENLDKTDCNNASLKFYVNNNLLGEIYTDFIAGLSSKIVHFTTAIGNYGSYTIKIIADENNQIPELNETNNQKTATVYINAKPKINQMPTITFDEDKYNSNFDLDDWVSDIEDSDANLTWTWYSSGNISVYIDSITHIANFTALPNWFGTEYVLLSATDKDGGIGTYNARVIVNPINDLPIAEIKNPKNSVIVNSTIEISGIAYDYDGNSTIKKVEIKIGEGNWEICTGTESWKYTWDTTLVFNRNYIISVRAYDGIVYSNIVSISLTTNNPFTGDIIVSPKNDTTGISLNTLITIRFRMDIDFSTLQLTSTPSINGLSNARYDNQTYIITIKPSQSLLPNTEYTLKISKTLKNKYGNLLLENDYTWWFTTKGSGGGIITGQVVNNTGQTLFPFDVGFAYGNMVSNVEVSDITGYIGDYVDITFSVSAGSVVLGVDFGSYGSGSTETFNTPIGETKIPVPQASFSYMGYDVGIFLIVKGSLEGNITIQGHGTTQTQTLTWTDWGSKTVRVKISDNAQNGDKIKVILTLKYEMSIGAVGEYVLGTIDIMDSIVGQSYYPIGKLNGNPSVAGNVNVKSKESETTTPTTTPTSPIENGNIAGLPLTTLIIIVVIVVAILIGVGLATKRKEKAEPKEIKEEKEEEKKKKGKNKPKIIDKEETKEEKLNLLEKRFLRGEISEETYKELKEKYEK